MRIVQILFCSLWFINFVVIAGEHTVASQINIHSAQDASAGYGVIYQYKFLENFEFEAKYSKSGDLKIIEQEQNIFGDFSSFSSGINFIKPHHQNLSIKLGFGINVITSSTNDLLVEESAVAPYFQIAVNYKLADNISLTFGQSSQFNQNSLGTNHSLYLSLDWLFSQKNNTPLIINKAKENKVVAEKVMYQPITIKSVAPLSTSPVILEKNKDITKTPVWYVQLGAYQQKNNAEQKRLALQNEHSLNLTVHFHHKLYRVLSQPFNDKKSAVNYLAVLQKNFALSGFVNKI